MNNFETAVNATNTALNSMGSAEKENAKYMESVEAKVQSLKAEFQDFANNVINSNEVKNVLSLVTDLLGKLNTEVGQTITKLVLFGAIITGGAVIWGNALSKTFRLYKDIFTSLVSNVSAASNAISGLFGVIKAGEGKFALQNILGLHKTGIILAGLTAIITAVIGISKAIENVVLAEEKHREKVTELKDEYEATYGKGSRYDELLSKQGQLTAKEQEELTILQAQNEELRKKIRLEEEAAFKAFQRDEGSQASGNFAGVADVYPEFQAGTVSSSALENLKTNVTEIHKINTDTITGMQNYLDKSNELIAKEAERYQKYKYYQELGYSLNQDQLNYIKLYGEELANNKTIQDEYNQAQSDGTRITKEALEANKNLADELSDRLLPLMEEYPTQAQNIAEQTQIIIDAYEEYVRTGNLSADTIERLSSVSPELIGLLIDENGELDLNAVRVKNVLDKLGDYATELETSTIPNSDTARGVFSTLGSVLDTVYGAANNASSGLSNAGSSAATSGNQAQTAAGKWANLLSAIGSFFAFLGSGGGLLAGYSDTSIGNTALYLGNTNKKGTGKLPAGLKPLSDPFSSYIGRKTGKSTLPSVKSNTVNTNDLIPDILRNGSGVKVGKTNTGTGSGSGGGGSSGGGGGSSKSTTDIIKEQYQQELKLLQEKYNNMEISDKEYYSQWYDLIQKRLKDHQDYEKEIKSLYDDEMKYYKHLLDMGEIDEGQYLQHQKDLIESLLKGTSYYIDTLYKWQEDWKKYIDKQKDELLKNQKSAMDKIANYYKEYAQRQLDITNTNIEETEKRLDAIDEKYEEKAKKRKEEYDDAIKAIDKQNDALERELRLEELLNNLAKAKNTLHRVYRNGRFVYEADADAISNAQRAIDEYNREQEETERKEALKSELEADLEVLEERRKAKREDLELWLNQLKQDKEFWESYKEGWSNLTKDYEYYQNKLLAEQVFGAEQEMMTNEKRLEAYRDFVSQYIHLTEQLEGATQQTLSDSLSGSSSLNIKPISFSKGGKTYDANVDYAQRMLDSKSAAELYTNMQLRNAKIEALGLEDGSYVSNEAIISQWHSKGLANGTLSASGGIHLVGENGAELRVLNNGDGIIPNSITKTLWSFGMNPSGFLGNLADKFGGSVYSFNISTLSLPNATDAQGLLTGLRNAAQQYVYQRA